jgi:hypothetical protein
VILHVRKKKSCLVALLCRRRRFFSSDEKVPEDIKAPHVMSTVKKANAAVAGASGMVLASRNAAVSKKKAQAATRRAPTTKTVPDGRDAKNHASGRPETKLLVTDHAQFKRGNNTDEGKSSERDVDATTTVMMTMMTGISDDAAENDETDSADITFGMTPTQVARNKTFVIPASTSVASLTAEHENTRAEVSETTKGLPLDVAAPRLPKKQASPSHLQVVHDSLSSARLGAVNFPVDEVTLRTNVGEGRGRSHGNSSSSDDNDAADAENESGRAIPKLPQKKLNPKKPVMSASTSTSAATVVVSSFAPVTTTSSQHLATQTLATATTTAAAMTTSGRSKTGGTKRRGRPPGSMNKKKKIDRDKEMIATHAITPVATKKSKTPARLKTAPRLKPPGTTTTVSTKAVSIKTAPPTRNNDSVALTSNSMEPPSADISFTPASPSSVPTDPAFGYDVEIDMDVGDDDDDRPVLHTSGKLRSTGVAATPTSTAVRGAENGVTPIPPTMSVKPTATTTITTTPTAIGSKSKPHSTFSAPTTRGGRIAAKRNVLAEVNEGEEATRAMLPFYLARSVTSPARSVTSPTRRVTSPTRRVTSPTRRVTSPTGTLMAPLGVPTHIVASSSSLSSSPPMMATSTKRFGRVAIVGDARRRYRAHTTTTTTPSSSSDRRGWHHRNQTVPELPSYLKGGYYHHHHKSSRRSRKSPVYDADIDDIGGRRSHSETQRASFERRDGENRAERGGGDGGSGRFKRWGRVDRMLSDDQDIFRAIADTMYLLTSSVNTRRHAYARLAHRHHHHHRSFDDQDQDEDEDEEDDCDDVEEAETEEEKEDGDAAVFSETDAPGDDESLSYPKDSRFTNMRATDVELEMAEVSDIVGSGAFSRSNTSASRHVPVRSAQHRLRGRSGSVTAPIGTKQPRRVILPVQHPHPPPSILMPQTRAASSSVTSVSSRVAPISQKAVSPTVAPFASASRKRKSPAPTNAPLRSTNGGVDGGGPQVRKRPTTEAIMSSRLTLTNAEEKSVAVTSPTPFTATATTNNLTFNILGDPTSAAVSDATLAANEVFIHNTAAATYDLMGALIDPWNDTLLQFPEDYRTLNFDFPILESLPSLPPLTNPSAPPTNLSNTLSS